MNARNKAFSKLAVLLVKTPDKLFEDRHLYGFVDSIIEAVKEEMQCPYPEACPKLTLKPELIQGLTAEQWQEIIAGGYLCEFSDGEFSGLDTLREFGCGLFKTDSFGEFKNCRVAQLKGVMRPIFVEPVDKASKCIFFNSHGDTLGSLQWFDRPIFSKTEHATKYIEL